MPAKKRRAPPAQSSGEQKISDLFPAKRRATAAAAAAAAASATASALTCAGEVGGRSAHQQRRDSADEDASSSSCYSRLFQQDLAVLRDFDLNWEFGPCIGITRLQRWERAVRRGLSPPLSVRNLVLAHPGNPLYTQCIWFAYSDLI